MIAIVRGREGRFSTMFALGSRSLKCCGIGVLRHEDGVAIMVSCTPVKPARFGSPHCGGSGLDTRTHDCGICRGARGRKEVMFMQRIYDKSPSSKARMRLDSMRQFKVIRIYRVWSRSRIEALTAVQKDERDEFLTAEFAVEEQPKGWFGAPQTDIRLMR